MSKRSTPFFASAVLAGAIGCTIACPSVAKDGNAFDAVVTVKMSVGPDGLMTEDVREEVTVNSESVVQPLGQLKLVNNDHFAELQILEVATSKSDGRRLDVPQSRIFTMSGSAEGAALFHADTATRVVPFPDLAVGDRRVVHYRKREKAARIAGVVELAKYFPVVRNAATYDVTLDIPDGVQLFFEERGLGHAERPIAGGRRLTWHIPPGVPPAAGRSKDRHLFFSNLKDWSTFGKTYAGWVAHVADPDATVAAKAAEITKGIAGRRETAKALFDWTSHTIRYFNVVLGAGGWMPHKPESILALRYGDCKDHATLLRALLAAKGIDSEFVLIHSGNVYGGHSFPVPMFNHMILYIPEFRLYLDPTDPTSSFEELPQALRDKPVVRIAARGGVAARTPLNTADAAHAVLTSEVVIDAAGKASGTSTLEADGAVMQDLRRQAQVIAAQGSSEVALRLLGAQRAPGTGSFEAPSYLAPGTSFRITSTFSFDRPFFGGKARAEAIPTGPRLVARPSVALAMSLDDNVSQTFVCGVPRTYVERLKIKWPEGVTLARTPANVDVQSGMASYKATYTVHGNEMAVERTYRHSPAHAYCKPAELEEAADAIRAAETDFATKLALRPAAGKLAAVQGLREPIEAE